MIVLVLSFLSVFAFVSSIPIQNGVVGEPEFACGSTSLILSLNTEASWEGTFYAKNHFNEDGCKTIGTGANTNAKLELGFDTCGVKRERSLEPRGLFVSTTVVLSFHPIFLTKIDRAYTVKCFYMEADKTVSQELEVSMLTTVIHTLTVPMPVCEYQILDGGPTGEPVQFTIIGKQVYHKWTCVTDAVDTFCMTVYDCFVDDGTGDRIQLLDADGCSLDQYLLGNLEYPMDLMAGREAHVFKYADRANLYFNCQIRITIKDAGEQCPIPTCATGGGGGARAVPAVAPAPAEETVVDEEVFEETVEEGRKKRSTKDEGAVLDVSVPQGLMVADVDLTEKDIPLSIRHRHTSIDNRSIEPINTEQGHCLSYSQLGMIFLLLALFILATITMAAALVMKRGKQ